MNLAQGRLFWNVDFKRSGSWIWRKLMKLRALAQPFLICNVQSGNTALFWHDNWTSLGPLIDMTGPNGPRVSGIPLMAHVSQACSSGNWLISHRRNPILSLLRAALPEYPPDTSIEDADIYLWRNSLNHPPGKFSASKTWSSLHPPLPAVPWFKSVWFQERIPKHAFILWVVVRDRLPTRDRLRSWGLNVPSDCLLCGSGDESKDHIFFACPYSTDVWSGIFHHPQIRPPSLFNDTVIWVQTASRNRKLRVISNLAFQVVVYNLWRERNCRLHSDINKPAHIIVKETQLLLRAKLLGLDRNSFQLSGSLSIASTLE